MTRRPSALAAAVALVVLSAGGYTPPCFAAGGQSSPPSSGANSAADHFRHGVALYKDGDYQGALVEFRRAQELSPNYRVLYDIGQSLYQLQRYAEALPVFEAYLAGGGDSIPPARRAAVEADLRALRGRVGRAEITVNLDGAEIRIDDQTVGTSPLAQPVLVSVGHRKVTVAKRGRVPLERFVDIAAGDRAKLTFEFPEEAALQPNAAVPNPPQPVEHPTAAPPPESQTASNTPPAEPAPSSPSLKWVPWATTGVLAAGAAVTGILTLTSKSSLTDDLNAYPASQSAIDRDRSHAKDFAIASDVLLGATAASFIVAMYVTLHKSAPARGETGTLWRLQIGYGDLRVRGDF